MTMSNIGSVSLRRDDKNYILLSSLHNTATYDYLIETGT